MALLEKASDVFFSLPNDYLRGNKFWPSLRRFLDLLFTVNISSYLFERHYFKYQLIDITDYKSIIYFFIKGDCIVPLSLFATVYVLLFLFGSVAFYLINTLVKNVANKLGVSEDERKSLYALLGKALYKKTANEKEAKYRRNLTEVESEVRFIIKSIITVIFFL